MLPADEPRLPLIPVANLLRIAFYAGDLLAEVEDCESSHDDGASFDDLLQAMLARAAERIRLRGFERGYSEETEVTARPRGRILINQSITSCALPTRRLVCSFDEFAVDTPHNRILKACARTLMRSNASTDHQDSLRSLVRAMRVVTDIALSRQLLRSLPHSLATRQYRVVRFVARLLIDAGQPDEHIGDEWARRLFQNEQRMRKVFERFAYRFARAHAPNRERVGRWPLRWGAEAQDLVGNLNTDVTIRGNGWTRIIECKYVRSVTTTDHYGNEMLRPEHLRQIYAYLARTRDTAEFDVRIDGVVMYPAITGSARQTIDLGGFPVEVIRLSLAQSWPEVHRELLGLLFGNARV